MLEMMPPRTRPVGGLALAAALAASLAAAASADTFSVPAIDWAPREYVCYRTAGPIEIDGALTEEGWRNALWTEPFVDIEGGGKPAPRFLTRAKMLWDDDCFYVAAEMEEPHVWATLSARDAVIFQDNDFEVFIDPDGDTHEYYELEVNALGTEWDLLLIKPYRDGGPAVDSWDIRGLRTGVSIDGTRNDPTDTDAGWTVELAIPWVVLEECAGRPAPPEPGDQWRVNFSRVEWRAEAADERYVKLEDPSTGRPLPEDNWVWSPQGLVNMHYPEMWGFVQFSDLKAGEGSEAFTARPEEAAKWALRKVYYAERRWFAERGRYTANRDDLGFTGISASGRYWFPTVTASGRRFEAWLDVPGDGIARMTEDGRVLVEDGR
jgi:hypothetical protein